MLSTRILAKKLSASGNDFHINPLGATIRDDNGKIRSNHSERISILALLVGLFLLGCSDAPVPLPMPPSLEGTGIVRAVDGFVLIGLDAPNDRGGLDGRLDYAFISEVPSSNQLDTPPPQGPLPIRVEFDKPRGRLSAQAGDSYSIRFHVPRFSPVAPEGSLGARVIYYRTSDSKIPLDSGVSDLLEEIREANQIFTSEGCQAGGQGASSCDSNGGICGVISGEGNWACCRSRGNHLCHMVRASPADGSTH